MMKNLFSLMAWKNLTKALAVLCCLTLTINQTYAQCNAGPAPTESAPLVCNGAATSADITVDLVGGGGAIPTGAAANLFGAYVITITDGLGNTATVLFEGMNAANLLDATVNPVINVDVAGNVTVVTNMNNSNAPVITGSPLASGSTYTSTGNVYLGTNPAPGGALIEQDACVIAGTNVTPASAGFFLTGEYLIPNGLYPTDQYDCVSPDVAQITLDFNLVSSLASWDVAAQNQVFEDAGLTIPAGTGAIFPAAAGPINLFVPANTVWNLTIQDNQPLGIGGSCESSVNGIFETPQAQLLALSNDYCELDPAHVIFGDPNGAPFVGPIVDPLDPLANDLPAGSFFTNAVGVGGVPPFVPIDDNGDNSANWDPFIAGTGQHSVFFVVGDDQDCQAIDEQIVNVYPSYIASFDGSGGPNDRPLPRVVCQNFTDGIGGPNTITFEPDVLNEDIVGSMEGFDIAGTFFIVQDGNVTGAGDELDNNVNFSGIGVVDGGALSVDGEDPLLATTTSGKATFDTSLPPGDYTITLFVGYEQCLASQTHVITIVEDVDATIDNYALCGVENGGQIDLNAMFAATTTPGGTFSIPVTTGLTLAGDVITYDAGFNGTVTVTYAAGNQDIDGDGVDDQTADNTDGDCYGEDTADLTINDSNPAVFFDLPDYFCGGDGPFDLTAFLTGGDVANAVTQTFEEVVGGVATPIAVPAAWAPANADASFAIRYTQTNAGGCNNLIMEVVDINFSGDATMVDFEVCGNAPGLYFLEELAADFNDAPVGQTAGTFTGAGVGPGPFPGTFDFDVTVVSGTVPVQYCIGSDECEECSTFYITVHTGTDPVVSGSPAAAICSDSGSLNLASYLNAGAPAATITADAGVLSASGEILDISGIAANTTINITYDFDQQGVTFQDLAAGFDAPAADCYGDTTIQVTVSAAVGAGFTTDAGAFVCADSTITVTTTGTIPAGATSTLYLGASATTSPIATTGLDGLYQISHAVTNGACTDSVSTWVYIIGTAVATTNDGSVCADSSDLVYLLNYVDGASTPGGTFSILADTDAGSNTTPGSAGTVSFDQLMVGADSDGDATTNDVLSIVYSTGIEGHCFAVDTFDLTIMNHIDPALDFPQTVCAGGTFDINGNIGTLTAAFGVLNGTGDSIVVSATAEGLYTLSNETDNQGCIATWSQDVFVFGEPVAAFTPNAVTVCSNAGTVDISQYLSSTVTSGGDITGVDNGGVALAPPALDGMTFDPSEVDPTDGPFAITYNVGVPGMCSAQATLTITVTQGPPPTTFDLVSSLCLGESLDLLDYVDGAQDGTFSVLPPIGVDLIGDTYTADTTGTNGTNIVTIQYNFGNGVCADSLVQNLLITVPNTAALEDNIVCQSADDWSIDLTQYLEAGPTINGGTFQFGGATVGGAFINEVEYSGVATEDIDDGDFIEIAGPEGTDLTDYLIVLYEPNQYTVNDTPQFGETNGRVYAVISPELGYGWEVNYDDPATPTNNKWCTSPDVLTAPGCPQIGGDPDVFVVRSVEEGVAGDWTINGTYGAANGVNYGAIAIDIGDDEPCTPPSWEGIKAGPAGIALVLKEDAYDTGDPLLGNLNTVVDGYCDIDLTVTQFVGYGGMGSTNLGLFAAVDGPAKGLSTTDLNVMDDSTTKSLQFTNAGWVVPNVNDAELNYPVPGVTCVVAADGDPSAEDESRGYLNWGQLASGDASVSGCDNSSAEENYFNYISPNGDILALDHFDATLFVGGLVANENDIYTAGSDGDSDGSNDVLFDFTKNQVLPICFTYSVPSGAPEDLCGDNNVCIFIMKDYMEAWEAPAFICEGSGEQNMNSWILEDVDFIPFTVQASASQTFSASIDCDENLPSLFISELNYFGKDVTSTDEHCVTYNYIQDAFAGGGFGGLTFIDYNPATDNVTVKFCDGVEISGLTGTDLSCYQLIFYRPDPTLAATGSQSTSLSYDVVYIDDNGIPVSTDVENLVYMDLYGTIDDDFTPNGDSDDLYFGFNGTSSFLLDGSPANSVPGFGPLDLRDPAVRAQIEFITAPTEFYTIPNPQDNALANSIPNYNGPCGVPFSPIDINADCAGAFIDPDGVPVSPLAGGIYIDINGNGLVDVGTDLLIFKDRDAGGDYDPGEQTTGGDGCVTTDDVFPWERDTECANDGSGRLTSGDAFTNRGRSNVGSRWFPILDIDEGVSGVGLYNKCADVGPISDDLAGETLEFLSWGEQLCVQNEADFTEAGPFEQQFSEVIDSLDISFGDLRSLQLMSCSELPASLVSGCGSCTDDAGALVPGATVWVTIFNGGAIKIPVCPNETGVAPNQFSNTFGFYNCQLDEDVSEAAPCRVEVTIADEDLPDNYIITSFLVQASATGGFVHQWELGDDTGCFYDESDRGCLSGGCGISPGRVNCIPGEATLGSTTSLVTGQSVSGFTLVDAVGNRNSPLGCDFAFNCYSTKVAERTYYLDIAAAVAQTLNFPVIPSGADSCYSITQDGTFSATLAIALSYEQCHYVGAFNSSDATVNGNIALNLDAVQGDVPVDPYWTFDPQGLEDHTPVLLTYDVPNANVGDADEATDDVSCIDNNTDEDQRDQLVNVIYSDPAELVDGALTVCSTSGAVNLVNYLAPGTPASGEFTSDAAAAITSAFSFDPAVAGAGAWTVTYTTNGDSQCAVSDNITINVVEVAVQAPTTVCSTDAVVALSANVDGTFSGSGVVAAEGGFVFDPAAAGAGTTELTFTTADCSGATTVAVTVLPSPDATFFVPSQACMADGDIVFAVLGDEGGTFTVNGEAIDGNVWTPNAAGYVAVEYTVTGDNGCATSELNHVNVFDVFDPTWTHEGGLTVCENDLPLTLTVAQSGGTWTADINSSVTVEAQEITEDVETESYVYTIDGATGDTLNIDTLVTVETIVIGTVEVVTFDADIENTDHGAFSVTYEGGGDNCGQAQTHVINVYAIPAAPEVSPTEAAICDGDAAPVLEMTGDESYCNCPVTFHVYDGDGNLVYDGDTFNEDVFDTGNIVDGPGDYTFWVHTVNKVCESDPVEVTLTVNESPEYDFLVGCTDTATGEAGIEINNVTTEGPYSVSINGSEFFAFVPDQSLNVLLGGQINTVVVQDGNGCQSAPMEIAVDEAVSFEGASDCPDGSGVFMVTVVPAGGTAPYQVSVNGAPYGDFDALVVETGENPTIRVKDSKGCESESRVVETAAPVTFTSTASCPDENGQSTIVISPVDGGDSYIVSVGGTDLGEGVLEFQAGGAVTVTVTSTTTGCSSSADIDVPAAATLGVNVGCPEFDNITGQSFTDVTFDVEGLSTVFINGNAIAGTSASLTAGTYEVYAVNGDGCQSATETVEIVDNITIDLINASSQTIVCGEGAIVLAPTGAGDGATYNYYLDEAGTIPATPASGDVWINDEIVGPRIIYVIATTADGCESAPLASSTYSYDEITVSDVQTTCNLSDGSYTVTFTISGGNNVFTINGASAPDSFTSAPIAQGEGYSFTIDDSPLIPSCEPITVEGPAPDCDTEIVAQNDSGATAPGEPITVNILSNDTGCDLSVLGIVQAPSCGEIVGGIDPETGNVTYVPDANTPCSFDTFVYEIIDCNNNTTTATVTIAIATVGDLFVEVERDCSNADVSGTYTLNIAINGGTAPYIVAGSINETLEAPGVLSVTIEDGVTYEVSVVDATGAEFFEIGGEIACTKLAVEFMEFAGEVQTEGNFLNWITASEENNDFFVVEFSTDGKEFAAIGTVDGAGTTSNIASYDFLHRNAPSGTSYYRIKAVDFDGEATYTKVINLTRGERTFDIVSVYPIPVSSVVNVNFTTKVKGSSTIQIHNVAGKMMSTQDVDTEGGINKVSLNVSSYPVGTYFMTIKNGEEVATTKFVKE